MIGGFLKRESPQTVDKLGVGCYVLWALNLLVKLSDARL